MCLSSFISFSLTVCTAALQLHFPKGDTDFTIYRHDNSLFRSIVHVTLIHQVLSTDKLSLASLSGFWLKLRPLSQPHPLWYLPTHNSWKLKMIGYNFSPKLKRIQVIDISETKHQNEAPKSTFLNCSGSTVYLAPVLIIRWPKYCLVSTGLKITNICRIELGLLELLGLFMKLLV